MPKTPIDYSKCCIYKICCLDATIDDIYVGSTTDMVKRRHGHKSKCNDPKSKGHNYQVYQFIREHGHWENWEMVRIESFPCENSDEMRQREREIFDELRPTLNAIRPKSSKEEKNEGKRMWETANPEKMDAARHAWRAANTVRERTTTKAWQTANSERVKATTKAWQTANPERVRANRAAWKAANVERLSATNRAWRTKRVACGHCGKDVCRGGLKNHQRSKKCVAAQNAPITAEPLEVSQVVEST